MKCIIQIELPDDITLGDITSARGAIIEASTGYVNWEELYNKQNKSISAPGRILLAVVHQLDNYKFKQVYKKNHFADRLDIVDILAIDD